MCEGQREAIFGIAGEPVMDELHLCSTARHKQHVPVCTSGDEVGKATDAVEVVFCFSGKSFRVHVEKRLDRSPVRAITLVVIGPFVNTGGAGHRSH